MIDLPHEDPAAIRPRLRQVLDALNLDAVVLTSFEAVSYYAGTAIMTQTEIPTRLASLIVTRAGAEEYVVCSIETKQVREQTDVTAIVEYTEFAERPEEIIANRVKALIGNSGRVGFEEEHLTQAVFARFEKDLAGFELVQAGEAIAAGWMVKPQSTIDILGAAARATVAAIENAAANTRPSDAEVLFAARIAEGMTAAGGVPKFIVVAPGDRSTQAHPVAGEKPFRNGDIWRVDVGSRFGRFLSDVARTGVVGEPSERQSEIMRKLNLIQAAGIAKLVPGNKACDVYHAIAAEYERQGIPFRMPHVGHALGIGLHESPMLHPDNQTVIEVGMVFCVEPLAIFADHHEGYHTEDLVAVTETCPLLLTTPQTELIRIKESA